MADPGRVPVRMLVLESRALLGLSLVWWLVSWVAVANALRSGAWHTRAPSEPHEWVMAITYVGLIVILPGCMGPIGALYSTRRVRCGDEFVVQSCLGMSSKSWARSQIAGHEVRARRDLPYEIEVLTHDGFRIQVRASQSKLDRVAQWLADGDVPILGGQGDE